MCIRDRDYIAFDEDSKIKYPTLSICFTIPFSRDKISLIDPDLNISNYLAYLEGEFDGQRFRNIDYSSITLDLDDYFNRHLVMVRNGTFVEGPKSVNFSHKVNFNGFSEWGWFYKCFEFTWEIANPGTIKETDVVYNRSQLLRDWTGLWLGGDIFFYIHSVSYTHLTLPTILLV